VACKGDTMGLVNLVRRLAIGTGLILATHLLPSQVYAQNTKELKPEPNPKIHNLWQEPEDIDDKKEYALPLSIRVEFWQHYTSAKMHATEFQSTGLTLEGTRLDLGDDFGQDSGRTGIFSLDVHLADDQRIIAEVLYENTGTTSTLKRDITFNEAFYPAGTRMKSEVHHSRTSLLYEIDIANLFEETMPTKISVRGGLAWDRISLKLKGKGNGGGGGSGRKGEDFGDELIPGLGLTYEVELAPWLSASASLYFGFGLLNMTYHSEKTSYRTARLMLEIKPSEKIILRFGMRYEGLHSEHKGREHDSTGNRADNSTRQKRYGPAISVEIRY